MQLHTNYIQPTMAPYQSEEYDTTDDIISPIVQSLDDALMVSSPDKEESSSLPIVDINDENNDCSTTFSPTTITSSPTPKSILRESKLSSTTTSASSTISSILWSSGPTVSFSRKLVTSRHTRARTHVLDIPRLYYSSQDIKQFKREYRQLVRVQSLTREHMLENSQKTVEEQQQQQSDGDDNMNFRSNSSTTTQHQTQSWDPLNGGTVYADTPATSPAPTGGIFSSVYDVVSHLSYYTGSSSDSSSPRRDSLRRLSITSLYDPLL